MDPRLSHGCRGNVWRPALQRPGIKEEEESPAHRRTFLVAAPANPDTPLQLLTYQENSYVWAWISDRDYRVSVRISKHAADQYKRSVRLPASPLCRLLSPCNSVYGRNVIDSRFFLVFVSSYRPIFSPRPLGPNASGNTPVSHISLEIDHVTLIGTSGHLFGNPRDLESDENMKEWVLGLRQDGGGG